MGKPNNNPKFLISSKLFSYNNFCIILSQFIAVSIASSIQTSAIFSV